MVDTDEDAEKKPRAKDVPNPKEAPAEEDTDLDFISDEAAKSTQRKKFDNNLHWDLVDHVDGVPDYGYIRFEHTRRKNHPSYAAAALYIANKESDWRLHPKFHIQPNEDTKERFVNGKKVEYEVNRKDGNPVTQRLFVLRMNNFSKFSDAQITKCGKVICEHLKENPNLYSKSIGQEGEYIHRDLSHCDLVGPEEAYKACNENHGHEFDSTWGRRNPHKLKAYFKKGQLPAMYAHILGAPATWLNEQPTNNAGH